MKNIDEYKKNIDDKINHKIYENFINQKKIYDSLVLSGGGFSGLSYIGVLYYLEENNLIEPINNFYGCSIGSIFCLLIIIGYTAKELDIFFNKLDISNFLNIDISNLFSNYGIKNTNDFIEILKSLMEFKNINCDITFEEIFLKYNKKITIVATCLNTMNAIYLSHLNYPNLTIIESIKMSICVPLLFIPIKMNDNYYIDGGIYDNYPMHLCKKNSIGFLIKNNFFHSSINTFEDYLLSIIQTFYNNINNNFISNYKKNTVVIDSFYSSNFLSENIPKLINLGYESTKKFFNNS